MKRYLLFAQNDETSDDGIKSFVTDADDLTELGDLIASWRESATWWEEVPEHRVHEGLVCSTSNTFATYDADGYRVVPAVPAHWTYRWAREWAQILDTQTEHRLEVNLSASSAVPKYGEWRPLIAPPPQPLRIGVWSPSPSGFLYNASDIEDHPTASYADE